jgi:hypothetical protein
MLCPPHTHSLLIFFSISLPLFPFPFPFFHLFSVEFGCILQTINKILFEGIGWTLLCVYCACVYCACVLCACIVGVVKFEYKMQKRRDRLLLGQES